MELKVEILKNSKFTKKNNLQKIIIFSPEHPNG